MDSKQNEVLRRIPSVERILSDSRFQSLIDAFGREEVKETVRGYLERIRRSAAPGFSLDGAATVVQADLEEQHGPSLKRVINGTGIIIHTNLGRAPVASAGWASTGVISERYSNLELDLATGDRGSRHTHIERAAVRLFGCEAALLTNNNAGAVLLVLATLARDREVIVSRSELVEIGGSFRVPDVIQQGGARLREVGTTNRTRAADYDDACTSDTGAILLVHQSNFQIVGFTETPTLDELVRVSRKRGVPLVIDEGSGRVVGLERYGLARSPTIGDLIARGADVVTCSTDKLIGATQGGLILGRAEIVARCAKHPLMRALRPGKESYGVVSLALMSFVRGKHDEEIPIYRMLSTPIDELRARAERITADVSADVCVTESALGGGTTPTETIPSVGVRLQGNAEAVASSLRSKKIPVIGRIREGRLILDLRTVSPDEDEEVVAALRALEAEGRE